MAKKQDAFYFDSFVSCVEDACKAADILQGALENFCPDKLKTQLDQIHAVEHTADTKKHAVMEQLIKAFITPIEREDIILLTQNIDEMVDKIEDVLMRMYCNNVRSVRQDALAMSRLLVLCCKEVRVLMTEFPEFKRSKKLKEHIIQINSIEEEADRQYIECVRQLHTTCTDPIEVMAWHEIYGYLEKCFDACEHVAETVETVIMKNT